MAQRGLHRDGIDPKGLIRESYNIDGIGLAECRTIFMDWAIGVPLDAEMRDHLRALLGRYEAAHPDHPMTGVLREGLAEAPAEGRRGGRRARQAERRGG